MKIRRPPGMQTDNTDEAKEITKLFEDGDRALIAADIAEIERIYADDYIQYDECGSCFTRQNVIENLQTGTVRFVCLTSTGRDVRVLTETFAIVHGSEDDVVERSGKSFQLRYIYMDVVIKRAGKWRIMASQLAVRS